MWQSRALTKLFRMFISSCSCATPEQHDREAARDCVRDQQVPYIVRGQHVPYDMRASVVSFWTDTWTTA